MVSTYGICGFDNHHDSTDCCLPGRPLLAKFRPKVEVFKVCQAPTAFMYTSRVKIVVQDPDELDSRIKSLEGVIKFRLELVIHSSTYHSVELNHGLVYIPYTSCNEINRNSAQ